MAATGKTPILLYGSTTPTNAPAAGNLTNSSDGCEIAINVADKNLFFKDSTNAVNTVPIRQSSASSNGWLSSTDWTTFNNKQPAGTYVTSVTGTAPVVSSGGTTPAISMAAATSSVNGYLTSTDWSTFNGKQAALVSGTNIKTVSGTTLLGSGDLGTIGTGYGGTGLTGFAAANNAIYSTSSSVLTAGTLPIAAGGTGATSFTANQIHYGSFSQSSSLTWDGTSLSVSGNIITASAAKGIVGSSSFSVTIANGAAGNLVDLSTALPTGGSGIVIVAGASAGKATILCQRDQGGYYSVSELGTQPRGTYITSITLSGTNLQITNSTGGSETFSGKVVVLTA